MARNTVPGTMYINSMFFTTEGTEFHGEKGKNIPKTPCTPWFSILKYTAIITFFFLVLSCRTVPPSPDPFVATVDKLPLEPGAFAYVLVDAKGARPLIELISLPEMNEKDAERILDRTNSMALALYPEGSERRFQLAAWGNISPGQVSLALGTNKDWKKTRCDLGHRSYYSQKNNTSLAVERGLVFVAQSATGVATSAATGAVTGAAVEACTHSAGTELPEGAYNFSRGTLVFCWFDEPDVTVNRFFENMGLPLQMPAEHIFFSLFPAASDTAESAARYEGLLRIQASGETQARALVRIISMARLLIGGISAEGALGPLMELLFSNAPVQEGKFILIKTPALSASEIALLIEEFLLYSTTENQ